MPDLIHLGSEIKMHDDGTVDGYLVLFGSPDEADFVGDYFTAETDFDLTDGEGKATLYFNHGLDPVLKNHKLNNGIKADLVLKDKGVWIQGRLNEADEYDAMVIELIKRRQAQGKSLGWSSGVPGHLVHREQINDGIYHIKTWSLGSDASLTHTPADYRNKATYKSIDLLPIDFSELPASDDSLGGAKAEQAKALNGDQDTSGFHNIQFSRGETMSEPTQKQPPAQPEPQDVQAIVDSAIKTHMAGLQNDFAGKFDTLSDTLTALTNHMENDPAVRKSGYFTQDGGDADPQIKSFGDFAMAVVRGDDKRLATVYKSIKAQETDSGGSGGYLVPHEFHTEIVRVASEQSGVVTGVTRLPVGSPAGTYPSLDLFTAPTAGQGDTAEASGITATRRAEGGSYTETDADFEQVKYDTNDAVSGLVKASRKLMQSVPALETLLRQLIGIAYQNKLEYFILRGSGVAQPLGILNADAKIDITPATNNVFKLADKSTMQSRFKAMTNRVAWVAHPSMVPDIEALEVGTGGAVWLQNVAGASPQTLGGYPIVYSQHLPQADSSGCILLIDLGAYALFEFGPMYLDYSEHRFFDTGQMAWRFGQELDGKPWLQNVITLGGPGSAYTCSPYVNFND